MGRMPPEVMQRELDTAWQNVFTYASWAIVLVMLAIAWQMGVRQRTPFYVLAVIASGVAAFAEPLYDVTFDLWFYDAHADGSPGAMQSHFTAFGVVQPNWTHSGYMILYANAALYAGRKIYQGRFTMKHLYTVFAIELVASCVFETIGTATDVYTYYGPYEFRIVNYPLVVGFLEATQVCLFTVLACQLWRRVTHPAGLLGLIALFPITMFGANCGVGFVTIITMHLNDPKANSVAIGTANLVTMGMCLLAVWGISLLLPKPFGVQEPDGAPVPRAAVTA
jgi:hypothetical protein